MKKLLFYTLFVFTLFAVYSCGDDEDDGRTKFTVTFDTDGGSAVPSQTVKEGEQAVKPEDPTKDNLVFEGWCLGDIFFDFFRPITADITLKAVYRVRDAFSISDTKQVYFAKGNVQYHCKNKEWRFAPNQYDCIGDDNMKVDFAYDGYIDLFGWGTGNNPTIRTPENDDYTTFTDWGVNMDGGNVWRTLTQEEWKYILEGRKDASEKYGVAEVAGVPGLILLPDYYVLPTGLSFNSGVASEYGEEYFKDKNNYSAEEWQKMESVGAVFLPAAGECTDVYMFSDVYGKYWTTSFRGLTFTSKFCGFRDGEGPAPSYGRSVRLARDL
ncbi:MAG: InlB B-repeat-containing protein [Bacteroidales bacterium]|nr:InlB B-repeat-containing protein [Bacteroidales bacterium]